MPLALIWIMHKLLKSDSSIPEKEYIDMYLLVYNDQDANNAKFEVQIPQIICKAKPENFEFTLEFLSCLNKIQSIDA